MNHKTTCAKIMSLAAPFALTLPMQAASLIVTPTNDGTTLVNSILGAGVTLVSGSVIYSGANSAASGTFSGGIAAGVGIPTGILMTTGDAIGAVGPNTSNSYTGSGATTSLEFKFTVDAGNSLFFNYVFASEEYNEFVGSGFNDSFSFLLDGTNIALIPSTSTPVTINNVNLGSNSAFYKNNSPGPFDLQYDGLTTVLTASALNLSAGEHTIKMTISDVGDSSLDSGVFIQGNSFSNNPTPPTGSVPDGGTTLALLGLSLAGLAGLQRKFKA
jgi:hypothetical protein